ncbi:hypothetical protein, partial [Raoultella ornithinolytica]|uniref:hypothetical protein n=1 Tax=Raoultella ornithinolytica TaxID=54291 RepID=UPI003AAAA856
VSATLTMATGTHTLPAAGRTGVSGAVSGNPLPSRVVLRSPGLREYIRCQPLAGQAYQAPCPGIPLPPV